MDKKTIDNIRKYFTEKKMFSELRGFNAGVRMFDDTEKHKGMKPVVTTGRLADGTVYKSTKWVPDVPALEKPSDSQKDDGNGVDLPWGTPSMNRQAFLDAHEGRKSSGGTSHSGGGVGW